MPHDDRAALLDIAYCCARIADFVSGRGAEEFAADEGLREAVQY